MSTPTQREYDDELAQEAPLVPDIGRPDGTRQTMTDGRGATPLLSPRDPDATTRHARDDELAQQAPLVPDLGRSDDTRRTPTTDTTDR
ncbi:MAG: hypothetical protein ABEJ73_10740 [Haloplanus sp.]